MSCEHDSIRDFVKTIPIYLTENSLLIDAIKLSERYNLGNICIVDENLWPIGCFNRLKLAKIKTLNQKELKTKKIKDVFQDFSCPIITYSHMKKYEVIDIMYQFKLSCLPVARAPWDKKLLGFVFLSDIIPSVKKSVWILPHDLRQKHIERNKPDWYTLSDNSNLGLKLMQEKIQSAEAFLKSLENPEETIRIMLDRIDGQTLKLINNYSDLISKVKDRTNIKDKDMYSCTIIIGYLLKSHIDRYELNKRFENN